MIEPKVTTRFDAAIDHLQLARDAMSSPSDIRAVIRVIGILDEASRNEAYKDEDKS